MGACELLLIVCGLLVVLNAVVLAVYLVRRRATPKLAGELAQLDAATSRLTTATRQLDAVLRRQADADSSRSTRARKPSLSR